MNIGKVRILLLVLSLLSFGELFGIDWGGNIDNATAVKIKDPLTFSQADKLALWFDAEFSREMVFNLQGSYTFSLQRPVFFNLELFDFEGEIIEAMGANSLLRYKLGRFYFSDITNKIFAHNIDGISLSFNYPNFSLSTCFGYSGLLFMPASTIVLSKADALDQADDSVWLAPPRLMGSFELKFPEIFRNQDLFLAFLFQNDLRSGDAVISEGAETLVLGKGGILDTQYSGFGFSGTIISSLYYDSYAFLGTGRTLTYLEDSNSPTGFSYQFAPIFSYLLGGGIRYYLENLLYSKFSLEFLFSSGDSAAQSFIEGNTAALSTLFIPITEYSSALLFSPNLGNIFLVSLQYSLKPLTLTGNRVLKEMQTYLGVIAFFRPTNGPISEAGLNPDSDSLYLGTEIDLGVNYRPFSDLGLVLAAGFFIPNNGPQGAFLTANRSFESLVKLELSFSF